MLETLLQFSIRNRWLVVIAAAAVAVVGFFQLKKLPIDAVPDITNNQVQINALAPSLSPFEVEQQVTFPMENALAGIPGLQSTRSLSRNGFSQVTAIFGDGVDIYFARQQVGERLREAGGSLPPGVEPVMGPIATGLGEIYMYTVEYEHPRGKGATTTNGKVGWQPARTTSFVTAKDGAQIFYKDWGKGQPIIFSHGWPLTADAWDDQMIFLSMRGFRCIAHDRRGHGRSTQTFDGNEMNTYADDLAAVVAALDLNDCVHIGHSTGGGEVARYLGRHGTKRAKKAVLIGAVPPTMLKTAANPGGLPMEVFDGIRKGVLADRSQFYKDLTTPFYGANRPGAKVSDGVRESFWLQGMLGGIKPQYDCITAFSETDFTEDLKKIDIPTLIIHGDDDQIVPFADSAALSSKLIKNATLKVYKGSPHGLCTTEHDRVNADLLEFIKG